MKALFQEIRPDGDKKLDGFIKAARDSAGARRHDDYPPLHFSYIEAAFQVLTDFFGQENVEIIREVVGKNAAGHCALTDARILELIYWSDAISNTGNAPEEILRVFGF